MDGISSKAVKYHGPMTFGTLDFDMSFVKTSSVILIIPPHQALKKIGERNGLVLDDKKRDTYLYQPRTKKNIVLACGNMVTTVNELDF